MSLRYALRTPDGREYVINGPFRIGRDRDCEICLDNGLVSHIHASVWLDHGHLLLRDERSRNGTFVNGRRLKPGANQYLHDGDHVRVADAALTVTVTTVAEGQPQQPAGPPAPETAHRAVSAGAIPEAPPAPATPKAPPLPAKGATPTATYQQPASPRSRNLALAAGCVAVALLCVCVLGVVGLGAANQAALGTALAPLGRPAPTPGVGTTPVPVATGSLTTSATKPAQTGNIPVQVLPTLPPATPVAPAAYAANSQAVAAALAALNQAQLAFIHDAHTAGLASGSLIDDLLNIAAAAFKLASDAESLVQASAAQAGGSPAAGQVASLYAGLAQYGYAQALDAQNLRLALGNGSLDPAGAATRVADYGARAWNPSVTDPAAPGNPFLPIVGNAAVIPASAPLSDAGAAALQASLGPQAGLQSWIAAPAQAVTRTVDFPQPIRPLDNPQAPELLASLSTAAGQADGDRASQADVAGLQRLGATITSSAGSHSGARLAVLVAQTGAQAMSYADTAALIMTADQKPGGKNLPAFPGGTGAALAKTAAGGGDAFINNVFGMGNDNTPTKTGETPITTAVPLVNLIISNVQVGQVTKLTDNNEVDARVSVSYDVTWQSQIANSHLLIECHLTDLKADGPAGTLHVTDSQIAVNYPGTITLICSAYGPSKMAGYGYTTLELLVGSANLATERAAQRETQNAGIDLTATAQAQATNDAATQQAALTQAAAQTQNGLQTQQAATQNALETEQAASQTAEHIATVTQAAAGTATAQAAGTFTLNGTFNLIQSDSGCQFSDGPSTSGTLQMNVNFNTGQATAVFNGGGGGTRDLSCSDGSGTMTWQQTYTANFSGTVDKTTGALSLSGTLNGNNNVSWSNCKNGNGDDAPCPAGYAHGYMLSVILSGTVDKASHAGKGTWDVQPIILPTSGDWGGG